MAKKTRTIKRTGDVITTTTSKTKRRLGKQITKKTVTKLDLKNKTYTGKGTKTKTNLKTGKRTVKPMSKRRTLNY